MALPLKDLNKRMLKQELRSKGHGTFFRSIGAVLGFRPDKGSLNIKKINETINLMMRYGG